MTESELRDVLLLRALEREASALAPSDPLAQALAADLAWAGVEAKRRLQPQADASGGEGSALSPTGPGLPQPAVAAGRAPASGRDWLAERAHLGLARLRQRWGGGMPDKLAPAILGLGWAWALPLVALALGWLGDVLAGARMINLLSLPLLGLLAWNGLVYLGLAWRSLQARVAGWRGRGVSGAGAWVAGPLHRALAHWLSGRSPTSPPGQAGLVPAAAGFGPAIAGSFAQWPRVRAGFAQDWLAVSGPLQACRLAALVHLAAAALALGVVASLYTRGLVLDYRAGWDSTFMSAIGVRRVLAVLLGPASALSGLALPDAAALASLRLARGGSEGAARWIHLWALTLVLGIVLPRVALAAVAGLRARGLARKLPLPPDSDDLRRLVAAASGAPQVVWVLPYSYQIDSARAAVLATLVGRRVGPQARLQLQPSLPQGAEDRLPDGLPGPAGGFQGDRPGQGRPDDVPAQVLLLMALTATPERESHGAMVSALLGWLDGRCPVQVWVDESGWRERLPGPAGAERLQQRRQAWTRLLAAVGQVPVFVDLGSTGAA